MEHKLEWLNEEEGSITFFEADRAFLKACFFVTGEEEAEFRIQDVVLEGNESKSADICPKITLKITECLSECFRLLWEMGLEETVLVEQRGSKIAEILSSTSVVQKIYSEFMMKKHLEPQKSTNCGESFLNRTNSRDGDAYENDEKNFFCRVLPYGTMGEEEKSYYLYEVRVEDKVQNKGIATACLTELFRLLSEKEPATVYLQVGSYNEPAVHLYKKLGFTVSEEVCFYAPEEE